MDLPEQILCHNKSYHFKYTAKSGNCRTLYYSLPSDKKDVQKLRKSLTKFCLENELRPLISTKRKIYVVLWDLTLIPRFPDYVKSFLISKSLKGRKQFLICKGMPTRQGVLAHYKLYELFKGIQIPRMTILSWLEEPSPEQRMFIISKLQGRSYGKYLKLRKINKS